MDKKETYLPDTLPYLDYVRQTYSVCTCCDKFLDLVSTFYVPSLFNVPGFFLFFFFFLVLNIQRTCLGVSDDNSGIFFSKNLHENIFVGTH